MKNLEGVKAGHILVTAIGAPCRVVQITSDLRADMEFASGTIENIGCGNLRWASEHEINSFYRMQGEKTVKGPVHAVWCTCHLCQGWRDKQAIGETSSC